MTEAAATLDIFGKERVRKPPRRGRIDPVTAVCAGPLVIFILAAVFAQQLAPYGFAQIDLRGRNAPPILFGGTARHLLGTDELGRDILSRMYFGLRTSMLIALGSATISLVLGTTLGLVASLRRGIVDSVIRVLIDFQASMPFLIIALAVLACRAEEMALMIELKDYDHPHGHLERIVAAALREAGMVDDVMVTSFDHVAMLHMREALPEGRTLGITHARHADIVAVARSARLNAISTELRMFAPGRCGGAGPGRRRPLLLRAGVSRRDRPRCRPAAPAELAGRDPRRPRRDRPW
jgi:ABC-type amino acid transport system permease subunit